MREQQGPIGAQVKRTAVVNARSIKAMDMPVTKVLIAINAVIFVFTEFVKTNPTINQRKFALYAPNVADGQLWRVVTSGFLHYGPIHIAMNMYILFQLGRTFENGIGKARFLGMYFAGMMGGSAGALLLTPNAFTGGASGAVFGMAAAAVVTQKMRGVSISQSQWGPMLVINLVITFANPQISKGGHLGGLIFGAIAAFFVLNPKSRGRDFGRDMAILIFLIGAGVAASYFIAKNSAAGPLIP